MSYAGTSGIAVPWEPAACRGTAEKKAGFPEREKKKEKIKTTPNLWAKIEIQKYWLDRRNPDLTASCALNKAPWHRTAKGTQENGETSTDMKYQLQPMRQEVTNVSPKGSALSLRCPSPASCWDRKTLFHTRSSWPQWSTSRLTPKTCFRSAFNQLGDLKPSG